MRSSSQVSATWADLLHTAVTQPGIISQAFSRFHAYSIGNQLLAMFQCQARGIPLGPIATFMRWKELGRHVKKGEKALTLCMPIRTAVPSAVAPEENPQEEERRERVFTRFIYRNHWFVLSQTEGAEFTSDPLPGFDALRALAALGIARIPFEMLDGNVQGYARGREVAINALAEQPESTLFHEVAHILLGHTAEGALNSDSRDRTPKDIRELEAECVALLCCEALGLPGADFSRGYVQHWYRGREVPERSAQRILHAADQILKAGRLEQ